MRYLSLCSGIEAATVAWHPMGWEPAAFAEIEVFPAAVLRHHYPDTPNLGDMTKWRDWNVGAIDLLVGGTPCQSFSVAGLRRGLSDPRGGLMLTFLEIAQSLRPRWVVWENVPGVLSSGGGRDFGSFLGALGELGYGWAYRVLDAQWCRVDGYERAVPQRRRRVFVVGCLGDATRAAKVLFERQSVERNPVPRRAKAQGAAADAEDGARSDRIHETVGALCADTHPGAYSGQDAYTGRLIPAVAGTIDCDIPKQRVQNMAAGHRLAVATQMVVRRLTPVERERLQGFPDDYTNIPWRGKAEAPDGPRYKALGNSMAVNCMRWIGRRIDAVEKGTELPA